MTRTSRARLAGVPLLLLAVSAAVAGCGKEHPIDSNTTCPCAPGWICEPTANSCVPEQAPGGKGGAPSSAGGAAGTAGAGGAGGTAVDVACAAAQPLVGSFDLDSQSALDALPLASEIEGDLTIRAGITTLEPLRCLRRVTGSLVVAINDRLTSLTGLGELKELRSLTIIGNSSLTGLDGLGALETVHADVTILSNPRLSSLTGLAALSTIEQRLDVKYNIALISIGLDALTGARDVTIAENDALPNLGGLGGLTAVNRLSIAKNEALVSPGGLGLTTADTIEIKDNPALDNLDGFERLTSVRSLDVHHNTALRNVEGLRNLGTVNSLAIVDCPLTSAAGLRGLNRIEAALGLSATRLTDLAGLERVAFGPHAYVELSQNAELGSLKGLSTSATRLSDLSISGGAKLKDLTGLEHVTRFDGTLAVTGVDELTSLHGLENLLDVGALDISQNPKLTSLGALHSLRSAPSFEVSDNVRLPNCEANALATRLGSLYTAVSGNDVSATCP
jgi:Leucine-rich repeat (LRR) protein